MFIALLLLHCLLSCGGVSSFEFVRPNGLKHLIFFVVLIQIESHFGHIVIGKRKEGNAIVIFAYG